MEERCLRREASEGRGNGVEFNLLDLEALVVTVHHVIGSEKTQRQVLKHNLVQRAQKLWMDDEYYLNITFFFHPQVDIPEAVNKLITPSDPVSVRKTINNVTQ